MLRMAAAYPRAGRVGAYHGAVAVVIASDLAKDMAGAPLLLMLLSLLQGGLEKRKYRRLKAAKARKARADQRGGW